MAIEFNDNLHVKINRPTDFRFGPFTDINQANATIPIAQRYHGLLFGVYTDPLNIATSDITYYYYWDGLSNSDIKQLGGKPPVDGSYANQAAMIAAQATQTPQYIYYDNTSYWEYLGTTNGNITDYRQFSFPEIIEVTTSQLATLTTNSQLIPGIYYKVTDYRTIHVIHGTTDVNTGPIEPMISLALSLNTLSQEAKSYIYVDDELTIDWTSKVAENGTTPRAGIIKFRRNVTRNISAYYDFRHVKWRRWEFQGYDWEKGFVAITSTDITLTLTWSPNLPGTLNTYRKWEIKFPSGISHNAGVINLTITKGVTSYTKQLVRKSTLLSDWTANELRNKVGPIIYNPGIDKFVLIDGYNVGESQIGFALARASTTYTIGNGLRVVPNSAVYYDVETFYYALPSNNVNNVQLGPNFINNVFYSNFIYNSRFDGYSENNIFVGNVEMVTLDGRCNNNIFHNDLNWAYIQQEFQDNVVWSPLRYAEFEAYSIRNTISVGIYNFNAPSTYIWDTTILTNAWGITLGGNSIEGSIITFNGSTRSDIILEREISASIIGWFSNADNLAIRRRLNSEYLSTFPTASDLIESLNLKILPTPSGTVTGLGRDSLGNIVTYTPSLTDSNKVSYNVADSKNATERNQARVNIGSTSATPQVIATAGAIDDLTITSNSLVFTGASVVLSGIVAGLDGEEVTILNASGTNLELLSQSALSTASNRFASGVIVPNLSIVRLKYRTTTARWVLENVGISDGRYLRKDLSLETSSSRYTFNGTTSVLGERVLILNKIGSAGTGGNLDLRFNGTTFAEFSESGFTFTSVPGWVLNQQINSGQRVFTINATNATTAGSFMNLTVQSVTRIRLDSDGQILHTRSAGFDRSVRRDELYLNYSQTVATAGTINDLAINANCKLLILTGCDDVTGIVAVDNTRLIRIEARGASRIMRDQSASSTAANRFALGADLTINDGEVYQFIYTNSRWRRVL